MGSNPIVSTIFKKCFNTIIGAFFNAFLTEYSPVLGIWRVLRWDGGSRTMPRIPIEVYREAHETRHVGGIELPMHNIDTPIRFPFINKGVAI